MARRQSSSISNKVYSILYKNIININLKPGTLVSEKDVSEKMNVSRTPVREAFIKLSKEGLVKIYPQKGSFITKLDLVRVHEERFFREALEYAVFDEFMENYTNECLNRLYENLDMQRKTFEKGDMESFIELDDYFHYIFFDEMKKTKSYDIASGFSGHYKRARFLTVELSGIDEINIIQHEGLIKAIIDRDKDKTRELLKNHLRKMHKEEAMIKEKWPNFFQVDEKIVEDKNFFKDL